MAISSRQRQEAALATLTGRCRFNKEMRSTMYEPANTTLAKPGTDTERKTTRHIATVNAQGTGPVIRSGYLVERLFKTPENNLFNYVKFNLVNQHVSATGIIRPRIMDIGCGLQVARRFLSALNPNHTYFGIDYEPTFQPDAIVDLNQSGALDKPMLWSPDVVMLLDVLEHLHENEEDLAHVVEHVARSMPSDARLIVTVPQWYRLDCLKLSHLHYPEHKIRLTQREWRRILEKQFTITHTQGVGYLSVIPYLPMALRQFAANNVLGRLFDHLRSATFEKQWIKPLDLFLSNTLGRITPFKFLSNDILFVAVPRTDRSSSDS